MLGDYSLPKDPPSSHSGATALSSPEKLSLEHFIAWSKSKGTVQAYDLHAAVLQKATGEEILSLYSVKKLASDLTELKCWKEDMCPSSCIAYTGKYKDLDSCPYVHKKAKCGKPRYKLKAKAGAPNIPHAQVTTISLVPIIKALYANAETSNLLRDRDRRLKEALHLFATASKQKTFSDFSDSLVHCMHYDKMGLFRDPRDIAFALSTDGAQLTMKKVSNTWIVVFVILNLPCGLRYKGDGIFVPLATPGPNPPGDIESFLWSIFQDMAMASEGIWVWDAIDSSYFVLRAHLCMALGDMLGSAKVSGMAGHSAIFGDRFSMVKGARSSIAPKAKAQYYPMSPPDNEKREYNPGRPIYDLNNLPRRTESDYWVAIKRLLAAESPKEASEIVKTTGVSRLPLCVASLAFAHPTFFPLDPFHLFYENCMTFMWDLWTKSKPTDIFYISPEHMKLFGELVQQAMSTLPPSFCGPIRDPFLKRNSQYKIYEWMALVHWYLIPIGIEIGFNSIVLENFALFVAAVEFAMTPKARTEEELEKLHQTIVQFLQGFEEIYIGKNPANISRARLCIFQLIHVPQHIAWNGSIRAGSQATVERTIGEMGRRIRSKKAVFANLSNQLYDRALLKVLTLYYPTLDCSKHKPNASASAIKPVRHIAIRQKEALSSHGFPQHLYAIGTFLGQNLDVHDFKNQIGRWGKVRLHGKLIHSCLSDSHYVHSSSFRYSRWFEVKKMIMLYLQKLISLVGFCNSARWFKEINSWGSISILSNASNEQQIACCLSGFVKSKVLFGILERAMVFQYLCIGCHKYDRQSRDMAETMQTKCVGS